jgi:protein-S-isoprenylcysteine O-methyltransferase Ste14
VSLLSTPEGLVSVLSVVAFAFQLHGAARTFVFRKSERPSLRHFVMPLVFILVLVPSLRAPVRPALVVPGTAGLLGAMALFEWARRSVRGQSFSYIFSRDVPGFLWTGGPFAHVRNPFYTSYLLSAASVTLMRQTTLGLVIFLSLVLLIAVAARQEEARFASSPLGDEYARYASRTGRFLPGLGRFPRGAA